MGCNCGTCKRQSDCPVPAHITMDRAYWSDHPIDLHPCAHGEAVVATAVAGYEFAELRHGDVHAYHAHSDIVFHDAWLYKGGSEWSVNHDKFCCECGLLTATAAQLPEMYADWQARQADQAGR